MNSELGRPVPPHVSGGDSWGNLDNEVSGTTHGDVLLERAVVALERIAGHFCGKVAPSVPDETLAADLRAGMSLRDCAKKHGVGVGRVRGAKARGEK